MDHRDNIVNVLCGARVLSGRDDVELGQIAEEGICDRSICNR